LISPIPRIRGSGQWKSPVKPDAMHIFRIIGAGACGSIFTALMDAETVLVQ
jgi:hypothetical protein